MNEHVTSKDKQPAQNFLRQMIGRVGLRRLGMIGQDPEAGVPTDDQQSSLKDIQNSLVAQGERVNWILFDQLDVPAFVTGLQIYCEGHNDNPEDYVRHSSRYASLQEDSSKLFSTDLVHIPALGQNWEEEGHRIDLDGVRSSGIDPSRVLYFRVTQPMESGSPKPEYYWTSDLRETMYGLNQELGAQARTAIILVSTLEDIASNGGLIDDINDDSGVAVRQIGTQPYDQSRALFTIPREHYVTPDHPFGVRPTS